MANLPNAGCGAFSDDIENVFPIDCVLKDDYIADVKIKICESDPECKIANWKLDLYSPVSPLKGSLTKENLVPSRSTPTNLT